MHRWHIQFSQMFNGHVSQSMVEVDADDIYGALEEFESIGYVNVRVQAVYRHRDGRDRRDFREEGK